MPDRQKVIAALEKGIATAEAVEGDFVYITKGEARKALELLKGQETRIMSREEIENADGYIWFEDKAQMVMEARYFRKGILFEIGCLPFPTKELNWKTYGTLWRYWTAMPTKEQRKAVKWNA